MGKNENGKVKHSFHIPGQKRMYMAGIYREATETELPCFVILTRAITPELAFVHDRMPLIVQPGQERLWFEEPDAIIHDPQTTLVLDVG